VAPDQEKLKIGVVDTMFARYNMGAAAVAELADCPGYNETFRVLTKTVPGFKDLAVAAKNLIEKDGCSIVVALGMPGKAPIDKQCAHEAAQGIMQAQLMTSTPILEVFVHEDESDEPLAPARPQRLLDAL
jgi:riboflavin synthase